MGIYAEHKFDILSMRPQGERTDGISDAFTEIENPFVKFKLTRFDLGEIEDIVDHTQQGFPRFLDH